MIMFSKSIVDCFNMRAYAGMRVGQAMYTFFDLGKVTGPEKEWCDRLYVSDRDEAYAMLLSRTDFTK